MVIAISLNVTEPTIWPSITNLLRYGFGSAPFARKKTATGSLIPGYPAAKRQYSLTAWKTKCPIDRDTFGNADR